MNPQINFLFQVLQVTADSKGNPLAIYPLLEANINKLDENFAQLLQNVMIATLPRLNSEDARNAAANIGNLSNAIREFPLGNRAINIEIAITGYLIAATVFSRKTFPQDWALTQNYLGEAYQQRIRGNRANNLEAAISYFHTALEVYTRQAFPQSWALLQSNLGAVYSERLFGNKVENLEVAISYFATALEIFSPDTDPELWAMTQINMGRTYYIRVVGEQADNQEQAIIRYKNALRIYTQKAFPLQWANTQNNLGTGYIYRIRGKRAENLEQAITYCNNALQIYTLESFPVMWAIAQNNLGNAYSDRIKGDQAENLEQAIACYKKALQVHTVEDFPRDWALNQHNLGYAYQGRILGERVQNLEEAITCYENALKVRTKELFPEQWAMTQNNLGGVYRDRIQGDRAENLEQAIACCENALQVYTQRTSPEQWGKTNVHLGSIYHARIRGEQAVNLEKAIGYYEAALEVFTCKAYPEQWAKTQSSLGDAYRDRVQGNKAENLEKAINSCKNALQIYTQVGFPIRWASVQNSLGYNYHARIHGKREENLENATNHYQKALQVYTKEAFSERWATVQNNLGLIYYDEEQIDKAIACFRLALEIHTPSTFPRDCFRAGRNFGDVAFIAKLWAEAIEGYHVSIEAIEQSRTWVNSDQRKQEILQDAISVYAGIVQACINNNQPDKAIEYVERSKARNLVEVLATRDLYPKGNFSETILEELDRLRREIVVEQRRIELNKSDASLFSTNTKNQFLAEEKAERAHLQALQQKLDNLITKQIQPIDPSFSLTQKIEPISFKQIQELLPNNQTALIEWYSTGNNLQTFIVTHQNKHPIVISSTEEKIQALEKWFVKYLQAYIQQRDKWCKNLQHCLTQLADILQIERLISHLPSECNELILIPYRLLHLFPLHALPINSQESAANTSLSTLFDRFPCGVRYAPSCQLLQLTQSQSFQEFSDVNKLTQQRLFSIQNPTCDLSYSDVEVAVIRQMFQPYDEVLVKNAAKKEEVSNQHLESVNYTHFSCHAYFNFQEPRLSALLLADCELSSTEAKNKVPKNPMRYLLSEGGAIDLEECLTLGEIFALNLKNCRLVTLSACETGLTEFISLTDEYISLPSGFLFAGSLSVVSSLWAVNDLSTALLMIRFYQNLQQGATVPIALNKAQFWLRDLTKVELQKLIEENYLLLKPAIKMNMRRRLHHLPGDAKPFEAPFYWAAFCAIGQ